MYYIESCCELVRRIEHVRPSRNSSPSLRTSKLNYASKDAGTQASRCRLITCLGELAEGIEGG